MDNLFMKGSYVPIDNNFISEGVEVLQSVSEVQAKYDKNDTDTFINELRDSIVGYKLGYELINIEKHGFDCKKSLEVDVFLEAKQASFHSKAWGATFNDTTYEKANAFKGDNLYLALAIWKNAAELLFIIYGKNRNIGSYLENRIDFFKDGHSVRSTQTLSASVLVFEYGFSVIAISRSKEQVLEMLRNKSRAFFNLSLDKILSWEEFRDKNFEL